MEQPRHGNLDHNAMLFEQIMQKCEQLTPVDGIIPTDVLELPDPIGELIRLLIRRGSMSLDQLAAELQVETSKARRFGDLLTSKGFFTSEYHSGQEIVYRARIARMRKRNIPLEI